MYRALNKKNMTGNNVSHANNKTKRLFRINRQKFSFYSAVLKRNLSILTTVHFSRIVNKYCGIDNFLVNAKNRLLTSDLRKLRDIVIANDTDNTVKKDAFIPKKRYGSIRIQKQKNKKSIKNQ